MCLELSRKKCVSKGSIRPYIHSLETAAAGDVTQQMAAPPRGFLLAMPVLIINLGMEMLYVLEQRLRAQQIPPEKGRRGAFSVCNFGGLLAAPRLPAQWPH
jgi:hypothetical protein